MGNKKLRPQIQLSLKEYVDAWGSIAFEHYQQAVSDEALFEALLLKMRWDMIIAHPPCTYMTNAGAVRMRVGGVIQQERYEKAMQAKEFFMAFYNADCPRIAVENPTPMKLIGLPPYTQAIQPYEHGHPYSKRTCLWLKGLPKLVPTQIMEKHEPYVNGGCKDAHGNYRRFRGRKERDPKIRSKTFPGIAKAMAEQWAGKYEVIE